MKYVGVVLYFLGSQPGAYQYFYPTMDECRTRLNDEISLIDVGRSDRAYEVEIMSAVCAEDKKADQLVESWLYRK